MEKTLVAGPEKHKTTSGPNYFTQLINTQEQTND